MRLEIAWIKWRQGGIYSLPPFQTGEEIPLDMWRPEPEFFMAKLGRYKTVPAWAASDKKRVMKSWQVVQSKKTSYICIEHVKVTFRWLQVSDFGNRWWWLSLALQRLDNIFHAFMLPEKRQKHKIYHYSHSKRVAYDFASKKKKKF